MGHRPNAYLAFGLDLGYNFSNVQDFDRDTLAWLDEDDFLDQDALTERLQEVLGVTPGVEIITYGGWDDPSFVLVASPSKHWTDWDSSLAIDMSSLNVSSQTLAAWVAQINRGLEALGMVIKDPLSWLLIADYPG